MTEQLSTPSHITASRPPLPTVTDCTGRCQEPSAADPPLVIPSCEWWVLLLWLNPGNTDSPLPWAWLHRQHFTVVGPGDPRGHHNIPLYWGVRPQREQGDSPDHPATLKGPDLLLGKSLFLPAPPFFPLVFSLFCLYFKVLVLEESCAHCPFCFGEWGRGKAGDGDSSC